MKNEKFYILFLTMIFIGIMGSAEVKSNNDLKPTEKSEGVQWENIYEKKIVLLYRSVGRDILKGFRELSRKFNQPEFNFITDEPMDYASSSGRGFILQYWLNMNSSPQQIGDEYRGLIKKFQNSNIDYAMLRFTPFFDENHVEENFKEVKVTIKNLKIEFPNTTFIISTFPLSYSKTTLKTRIKKIIGKDKIWEYDNNIVINGFNHSMRDAYGNEKAFFDLALIQSTFPDGKRSTFSKNGKEYYHMVPEYTNDGTHLSAKGREVVAKSLLSLLESLSASQ